MSPSPPLSPASDSSSVIIMDDPEEQINPPARTSLAARFRNLTRTSPSPSPEPIPPPPPPPIRHFPCKLVTAVGSYRPIVSRNANNRPRVRASQVRSCDQCRTSKQKCDRNLPCATCSMRRVRCTWNQAGSVPLEAGAPNPANATLLAANRAEISRLRKEANTLARLLRLTPHEFELFHLEAKRLVEGGRGQPIKIPSVLANAKRPRPHDDDRHGDREAAVPNKLPRRLEDRVPSRLKYASSQRSPVLHPLRPANTSSTSTSSSSDSTRPFFSYAQWIASRQVVEAPPPQIPAVRPSSLSSRETKATSTSPVLVNTESNLRPSSSSSSPSNSPKVVLSDSDRSRPTPQSRTSFSDLPPLKIPSLAGSRPLSTLPLRSAQHLTPSASTMAAALTSTSTTTANPPRRRPNYVLPTPVYSSTPTSASFFPLSNFSSSLNSKPLTTSKSWSLYSQYELTSSSRVQPYTPLSAVRDELPPINVEKVSDEDEEKQEKEGEQAKDDSSIVVVKLEPKESPLETLPKALSPSLRNLLND